jgi:NhaP-type Na+/H+ or K+/H+ antiporter
MDDDDPDASAKGFYHLLGGLIAGAAIIFYVVWLVSKMTRTPAADEVALLLTAGFACGLLAIVLGVSIGHRKR